MSFEIKSLSYVYQRGTPLETPALENVSFSIGDGEFVGIMGHTGCGKSTLLHLMVGLLPAPAGTVLIDGEDINRKGYDRSILRRKLGVLFQFPESQLFESTVEKDVAFGLKHSGLSTKDIEQRVQWAIETVGLNYSRVKGQSPLGLSGGEKRRAAIAGVLAVQPRHLILDEPTVGLDPMGREALLELLVKLNRDGMTILMVSHDADSLGEAARRLLVLHQGHLAADGPIGQVFANMDAMADWGLGVSQSREIAGLLVCKGLEIPRDITSYRQLLPAVLTALKGGGSP